MSATARTSSMPAETDAARIVDAFLEASMRPDPDAAAVLMAPDVRIVFTGGRVFSHPREATSFNAGRYRWVKKRIERNDVVPGADETVVYNLGTLYGEWPDGTPFEGNRYIDRFVVRNGVIVSQEVWNDSAERILTMQAER
jgi:ketosteroid isomerase-like protein